MSCDQYVLREIVGFYLWDIDGLELTCSYYLFAFLSSTCSRSYKPLKKILFAVSFVNNWCKYLCKKIVSFCTETIFVISQLMPVTWEQLRFDSWHCGHMWFCFVNIVMHDSIILGSDSARLKQWPLGERRTDLITSCISWILYSYTVVTNVKLHLDCLCSSIFQL